MSFRECIVNGEAEGSLTPEQSENARQLFDELEQEYTGRMSAAAAKAKAARETFDTLQFQVTQRKRRKIQQIRAWKRVSMNLDEYRDLRGNVNYGRAALALIDKDELSRYSSVVQRQGAVERIALSKMDNVLATFRKTLIGATRNKAKLQNLVREAFGEDTGDASAKELAQAWYASHEYLRKRFNAAGGSISRLENWGFPQAHDTLTVRKAGFTDWRDFVVERLDPSRMIDQTTGRPINPEKLEIALNNVYQTISLNGFNKLVPGSQAQGRSLGNTRTDHRFLVFKNAESWMEYQSKFGSADPFDSMMGHIQNMARDIGMMEILGPNPKSTIKFLQDKIRIQAAGDEALENAADRNAQVLESLYLAAKNETNRPIDGRFARTFAGLRQILQSAQLGSAALLAITGDINTQRITRQAAGLPVIPLIRQYLSLLSPLGAEEKGRLAVRLGLIADGWTSIASAQMRYTGDITGPEITRRIADFTMRATALSPITQAGRWAFGMEFLGFLADSVNKKFDELSPELRNTMERYNIAADHWDYMRSTELYEHEGATFLSPDYIEARTDINPRLATDLATKLLEMIETETNFAVPSTSLRGRVALVDETRPGSVSGELVRSFGMYKAFAVTMVNTHMMRAINQPGYKAKGRYAADLVISMTVMGALGLQLKEISKGRDPRPMTDEAFWGAALLTGGGLGVFGDFLFSPTTAYGVDIKGTIAGPVAGFASDVINLTTGNLQEAVYGEDTKIASELINFAARYTPGSSFWYARLASERLILDQLRLQTDPKARAKMRRLQTRYRKEFGQQYWWKPGEVQPRRSPDLSNIMEETR